MQREEPFQLTEYLFMNIFPGKYINYQTQADKQVLCWSEYNTIFNAVNDNYIGCLNGYRQAFKTIFKTACHGCLF